MALNLLGRALFEEDVQRFWREVCHRETCHICGSTEAPMIGESEIDSVATIRVQPFPALGALGERPIIKGFLYTICSNCGTVTQIAADRILHWKNKGA